MTWSFLIRNGDLSFAGPGGFATVSGQNKLIQDLRNWLLEPRGSDPMHQEYGSTLDGGTLADGTIVPSPIGGTFTRYELLTIENEIRRILSAYQTMQAARIRRDNLKFGGKNTFSTGEILRSVDEVKVTQVGDTAVVNVRITTGNGDNISFTQPIR
jgi:hypothetical protein